MTERESRQPEIVEEHGLRMRRLRHPDQLRALAHPRRMEIADLLMADGPLTASECAERLGDSAASCSYHLRQLARFGFVTEAEGGRGRNRPWRWVPMGNRIDPAGTPADRSAAEALDTVIDARNIDRIRRYRGTQASEPWRDSAGISDYAIRLTEAELLEVRQALTAILAPLQTRTFAGEAPPDARLVDVLTFLLPRPSGTSPRRASVDDA